MPGKKGRRGRRGDAPGRGLQVGEISERAESAGWSHNMKLGEGLNQGADHVKPELVNCYVSLWLLT